MLCFQLISLCFSLSSFVCCFLLWSCIHILSLTPFLTHCSPSWPLASYSGWSQSKCLSRPLVFTVFSVFRLALLFPLGCWILSPSVLLSVCIALGLQCSPSSETNFCDLQVVHNLSACRVIENWRMLFHLTLLRMLFCLKAFYRNFFVCFA